MLKSILSSKQTYSVADQILLSLANLIASYWLLSSVGVEIFGLYSFLMVVCNLISGSFSSFLHGQMTLRIAGKPMALIKCHFLSTLTLYVLLFGLLALLLSGILWVVDSVPYFEANKRAILAAIFFAFLLSLFDLFRKFTYVLARQDISVLSTTVFFVLLMVGLGTVPFDETNALFTVFLIFSISKLIALCVNSVCIGALGSARAVSLSVRIALLRRYWEQGKFSFMGMLTSWVQNQGITPLLLVVSGPLVVGYFNLARLLTVPVTVVNTGLVNSALPRLREAFNSSGLAAVEQKVSMLTKINMLLSVCYFLGLSLLHFSGALDYLFPDYRNAVVFLIIWSAVAITILYRSWITQQYVVAMKFRFLLVAGIVSATVTYVCIGVLFTLSQNYYVVPVAVLLGETFLICMLKMRKKELIV